jgi:hypothetical protein
VFPLTEREIRESFVNASRKEVSDLMLPPTFDETAWAELDYLGWRDPKMARRSYIVVIVDGLPVGVVLRQAEASPRRRAQCTWCQDVKLPNDVVLYTAKRAGASGRNGNTVGTLICDEFQCSKNVRRTLPPAYLGFDVDAARDERIATLRVRSERFVVEVSA